MMRTFLSLALFALTTAEASLRGSDMTESERELWASSRTRNLKITVTNIANEQPMSGFFIAVHDSDFPPLYEMGMPAPDNGLANLAENGNATSLVDYYTSDMLASHSSDVRVFSNNGPLFGGDSISTIVTVSRRYPFVSLASMAINTNDCFVGFAGRRLEPGMSFTVPGLDSGTEENNENCISVPGPACAGGPRKGHPDLRSRIRHPPDRHVAAHR